MSLFDGQRLDTSTFKMSDDIIDKMRNGWYSDVYFNNTISVLTQLAEENYSFGEIENDLQGIVDVSDVNNGDLEVEMQFFTRRRPFSIVVGIDEALAILRTSAGYKTNKGEFVSTYEDLEIEAVMDGDLVEYDGDPMTVKPVLKIRGKYRYFGHLETALLGVLSVPTRIATNVYNVLVAANGKPILFFPARFDHYKMQGVDGYAYWIAVQRYNYDFEQSAKASVSTHAQGDWWGGHGGGTIAHSTIATFLGNTSEAMLQFARIMPSTTPRIALVDFHNDCIRESKQVISSLWPKYLECMMVNNTTEAEKYKLFGVRPDTSGNMVDRCLLDQEINSELKGVNEALVRAIRKGIDEHWLAMIEDDSIQAFLTINREKVELLAKNYCNEVKIVVTGGFNAKRIMAFEEAKVPVDIYGVGSSLLENASTTGTNNDFTADIVRVKIKDQYYPLSKVGRKVSDNPQLRRVDVW